MSYFYRVFRINKKQLFPTKSSKEPNIYIYPYYVFRIKMCLCKYLCVLHVHNFVISSLRIEEILLLYCFMIIFRIVLFVVCQVSTLTFVHKEIYIRNIIANEIELAQMQ